MSGGDPRYVADIARGASKSAGGTYRGLRWPDEIRGLGLRTLGVFTRCASCPKGIALHVCGTWIRYGGRAFCEACAIEAAAKAGA